MDKVEHQMWILVQLLEKAEEARLAGMPHLIDYALMTMKRLLIRRYPLHLSNQN